MSDFPIKDIPIVKTQHCPNCEAQAAEIERLQAEAKAQFDRGYYDGITHPIVWYDALREALERIAKLKWDTMTQGCNAACEASKIARAALEQGK